MMTASQNVKKASRLGPIGSASSPNAAAAPTTSRGPLPRTRTASPIQNSRVSLNRGAESIGVFGAMIVQCLRCFPQPFTAAAQVVEDGERTPDGKLPRFRAEGGAGIRHHVGVLDAGENMDFDVLQAGRHCAKRLDHFRRRLVVLIAPDDANRRGDTFELADVILQARAVA